MSIFLVTGAGRCGTHLIGTLVDGHPQVNSFPFELQFINQWYKLLLLVSTDGQNLPGTLVNAHIKSISFNKTEIEPLVKNMPDDNLMYSLHSYLEAINQCMKKPKEHFLFHAQNNQPDVFFGSNSRSSHKVVIMLRHPIQNYLAYLNFELVKGYGYRIPTNHHGGHKLDPTIGLPTVTQHSFLKIVKAFIAATRFKKNDNILISKLEDFTSDPLERQRVWDFLGISADPTLETMTRNGKPKTAGSTVFKDTKIRKVTTDIYNSILSKNELFCFEQYHQLFSEFYPDFLSSVKVVPNEKAYELLRNREQESLTNNIKAQAMRQARIEAVLKNRPDGIKSVIKWPIKVFDTLFADVIMYPQLRISRHKKDYKASSNLKDALTLLPKIDMVTEILNNKAG